MKLWGYGAAVLLAVAFLAMLVPACKSRKPFRLLLLNGLAGITALAVIDLTAKFTGMYLPVNPWTAAGSALYGMPAVGGFLVLQILFR